MRITVFLMLGLVSSMFVKGQESKFSGVWELKGKTHVAGPEYGNAIAKQMKIDQRKDSIVIESLNTGADGGDVVSRISFPMDGKKVTTVSASSKRKLVRSVKWGEDKKSLVFTIIFYMPENENEVDFTRVETWKLDESGLQVNKRSIETRYETWEVNAVFVKSMK